MAEDTSTQQDGNDSGATSAADDGFTPITTQADLDRIIGDRVARERGKFADYPDLKAKAAQVDDAAAATAAVESERDAARVETLRWKTAAAHGIDTADVELFLTGTDEDTLEKQATRLVERVSDRHTQGNHVPGEGTTTPPAKPDQMTEYVNRLFGDRD